MPVKFASLLFVSGIVEVLLRQAESSDLRKSQSLPRFPGQEIYTAFPTGPGCHDNIVAHRDGCMQHTAASRDHFLVVFCSPYLPLC